MSCKLWLNVWTCRSFTCPFTRRNLDRNPTAALISGFIVPRAQRVCIEKGKRRSVRCFPLRTVFSLHFFFWAKLLICLLWRCFSWHLFVEVEGGFSVGRYSVGGTKRRLLLLLVNTEGGWGGPSVPRQPTRRAYFPPPE